MGGKNSHTGRTDHRGSGHVANRALAPASNLAAAEWAAQVPIPVLDRMDDDHAYRPLALLIEAEAKEEHERAVSGCESRSPVVRPPT